MDTELTRYLDEMRALLGKLELRAKGEYPKPTGWKAREGPARLDGDKTWLSNGVIEIHPSAQRVIFHRDRWAGSPPSPWYECHTINHDNHMYEHAEFLQISSEPAP